MAGHKQRISSSTLTAYLPVGIALVAIGSAVSEPQWLKIGILLLGVVFISTISIQLLREAHRRRKEED